MSPALPATPTITLASPTYAFTSVPGTLSDSIPIPPATYPLPIQSIQPPVQLCVQQESGNQFSEIVEGFINGAESIATGSLPAIDPGAPDAFVKGQELAMDAAKSGMKYAGKAAFDKMFDDKASETLQAEGAGKTERNEPETASK